MGWFGRMMGDIAGTLFPGAKGFVEEFVDRAVDALKAASREFVASWLKNSSTTTRSAASTSTAQRSQAESLSEEERELGEKFRRDGRRTQADADRIDEINAARSELREKINKTNAIDAAQDIASNDDLIQKELTADELASQVGLVSTRECPTCAGIMTLNFWKKNSSKGQLFLWRCTVPGPNPCPSIILDPKELQGKVSVREPIPDLDLGPKARETWVRPDVLAKTAARVRGHLGETDTAIVCPHHLLPMKLLPMVNSKGLLLDSYQYTCLSVNSDGRACSHTVPVQSFGQVSSMLVRTEGLGIL